MGVRQPTVLAWLRLARVFQKVDHATAAGLRTCKLSVAQFDILAQLGTAEGITQQELADRLLVTKGNVSQLLARMEQRALIRRCQDGRTMRLYLTPAGRHLHDTTLPAQEALLAACFAALDPTEQQHLLMLLRKLDQGMPA